jgi:hypothetical protein
MGELKPNTNHCFQSSKSGRRQETVKPPSIKEVVEEPHRDGDIAPVPGDTSPPRQNEQPELGTSQIAKSISEHSVEPKQSAENVQLEPTEVADENAKATVPDEELELLPTVPESPPPFAPEVPEHEEVKETPVEPEVSEPIATPAASAIPPADPDTKSVVPSRLSEDTQRQESLHQDRNVDDHRPSLAIDPIEEEPSTATMDEERENRHKRHDSAIVASPGRPRRSSSVRSVLQSYRKVFAGRATRNRSPSRDGTREARPSGEFDNLRRTVQKYEAQLEEASTTILLQDSILAKWEKQLQNVSLTMLCIICFAC